MAFAKAFGVMPSTHGGRQAVRRRSIPDDAAFAAGGAYAQGPVNLPGFDPVMAAFNTQLATASARAATRRPCWPTSRRTATRALKGQLTVAPSQRVAHGCDALRVPPALERTDMARDEAASTAAKASRAGSSPPDDHHPRAVPVHAHRHGALGEPHQLERQRLDPFGGGQNAAFVGAKNYTALFTQDGLTRDHFMQSIGNTFWYVLLVVPLQTAVSLWASPWSSTTGCSRARASSAPRSTSRR